MSTVSVRIPAEDVTRTEQLVQFFPV
jgi:hypothetical protein